MGNISQKLDKAIEDLLYVDLKPYEFVIFISPKALDDIYKEIRKLLEIYSYNPFEEGDLPEVAFYYKGIPLIFKPELQEYLNIQQSKYYMNEEIQKLEEKFKKMFKRQKYFY